METALTNTTITTNDSTFTTYNNGTTSARNYPTRGKSYPGDGTRLGVSFRRKVTPKTGLGRGFSLVRGLNIINFRPNKHNLGSHMGRVGRTLGKHGVGIDTVYTNFRKFVLSASPTVHGRYVSAVGRVVTPTNRLNSANIVVIPTFGNRGPTVPRARRAQSFLYRRFGRVNGFTGRRKAAIVFRPLGEGRTFCLHRMTSTTSVYHSVGGPNMHYVNSF